MEEPELKGTALDLLVVRMSSLGGGGAPAQLRAPT